MPLSLTCPGRYDEWVSSPEVQREHVLAKEACAEHAVMEDIPNERLSSAAGQPDQLQLHRYRVSHLRIGP
jgi:hypothetical protein